MRVTVKMNCYMLQTLRLCGKFFPLNFIVPIVATNITLHWEATTERNPFFTHFTN